MSAPMEPIDMAATVSIQVVIMINRIRISCLMIVCRVLNLKSIRSFLECTNCLVNILRKVDLGYLIGSDVIWKVLVHGDWTCEYL